MKLEFYFIFIVIFSTIWFSFIDSRIKAGITTNVVAETENMEILNELEKQIWNHEGFRSRVYLDPAGTIFVVGVGRNIQDKGISKDEALYMLRNDIQECTADLLDIFDNFGNLSEGRRMALIDMRFNLGRGGFREFKDMIRDVRKGSFDSAARHMMESKWYKQVGDRGKRLVNMMLEVKNGN